MNQMDTKVMIASQIINTVKKHLVSGMTSSELLAMTPVVFVEVRNQNNQTIRVESIQIFK